MHLQLKKDQRGSPTIIDPSVLDRKKRYYSPWKQEELPYRFHFAHCLKEMATDMVSSILNNIKIHFMSRQLRIFKILNPGIEK